MLPWVAVRDYSRSQSLGHGEFPASESLRPRRSNAITDVRRGRERNQKTATGSWRVRHRDATRRVVPVPREHPRAHQKFRRGGINVLKRTFHRSRSRALFAFSPVGIVYKTVPGRYLGARTDSRVVFPRNKRDRVTSFVRVKRVYSFRVALLYSFLRGARIYQCICFLFFFRLNLFRTGSRWGTVARTWEQCMLNDI